MATSILETLELDELYIRKDNLLKQLEKVNNEIQKRLNQNNIDKSIKTNIHNEIDIHENIIVKHDIKRIKIKKK